MNEPVIISQNYSFSWDMQDVELPEQSFTEKVEIGSLKGTIEPP